MRTLSSVSVVTAAAAACLLSAPTAYATPSAKGDNGTVKIHDAATGEEVRRNQPKVCEFYLDAFGFDARQKIRWKIVEMPPTGTKGTVVQKGALVLDAEGHGRTEDMVLADGHYKLVWNFKGEKGRAKHKVFWTECEDGTASPSPSGSTTAPASPVPTRTGGPGATPTDGPSGGPSGEPSGEPSATSPEESSSAAPASPAASASPQGGNLAETGSSAPVAALTAAAAALLGAGSYLLVRRRTAARD